VNYSDEVKGGEPPQVSIEEVDYFSVAKTNASIINSEESVTQVILLIALTREKEKVSFPPF
jgi:hypothetical protein